MNKIKPRYLLAGALAMVVSAGWGAKLPQIEIQGKKYFTYTVKKGDSLYGISKTLGWNAAELTRLNPGVASKLEKGMKLYYQVPEVSGQTTASPAEPDVMPGLYTLKQGDTLASVAKGAGIPVSILLAANPGVSEYRFKAGDVIKVPEQSAAPIVTVVEEKVEVKQFDLLHADRNDSWETLSAKTGVESSLLQTVNATRRLKKQEPVMVPVFDTVRLEREVAFSDQRELTPEGREKIYAEVHRLIPDSVESYVRVAYLMGDPDSRRDLEFSRGFLYAVKEQLPDSLKTDVLWIKGTDSQPSVTAQLESFAPTLIVTTTDKELPSYLTTYSSDNAVPLVNVFNLKGEQYLDNPYIVQYLIPSNDFNAEAAGWIASEFYGRTIILIGGEENDGVWELVKAQMPDSPVLSLTAEEAAFYPFDDNGRYLVYAASTKKQEVEDLLAIVGKARQEAPLAEIAVVGRPNWITFDGELREKFNEANVYVPSRFYIDLASPQAETFVNGYKEVYAKGPYRSHPLFAAMGYDVASYFLPAMVQSRGDLNALRPSGDLLQTGVDIRRRHNWSGFYNTNSYIVNFRPSGIVEKILLTE